MPTGPAPVIAVGAAVGARGTAARIDEGVADMENDPSERRK